MQVNDKPLQKKADLRWGWAVVIALALGAALLTGMLDWYWRSQQRLEQLETAARRGSLEIMSATLNGNLMGAITLLGLMDSNIKQEAAGGLLPEDNNIFSRFSILGRAFHAQGVFLVGRDGVVRSSWERSGKPSTGTDVRFRPYYQRAMVGQGSVYAGMSVTRGERVLYFSAPIFDEAAPANSGVGAVVARTDLGKVDALLTGRFDKALLLSPQGVVFASNQPDWFGRLEGSPTPQRLQEIRRIRQFGALFEQTAPLPLPVRNHTGLQRVDGQTFAVAQAPIDWNDPGGNWTLLIMEDLSRTVPWLSIAWKAALGGLIAAVLGGMGLYLLRARRVQALAAQQLQRYAQEQDHHIESRRTVAALSTALQHCVTLESFSSTFFQRARTIAGVVQGALYSTGNEDGATLVLAGACACTELPPKTVQTGEGLLGQAVQERQSRWIPLPEDDSWTLRSGTGSARAAALFIAPLQVQGRLVGAVEMAFLQTPDANQHATIDELVSVLANHLEILRRALDLERRATHRIEEVGEWA